MFWKFYLYRFIQCHDSTCFLLTYSLIVSYISKKIKHFSRLFSRKMLDSELYWKRRIIFREFRVKVSRPFCRSLHLGRQEAKAQGYKGTEKTASKNRSGLIVLALPIFPASHPASIVGASELNFCVRDGNRWTLVAINTNYFVSIYLEN